MPAGGGAARLLVAHSAHESRPLYSPDGRYLAFNSNRSGGEDVFLMDLSTGQVTRLTHESGSEQVAGWSGDGAWVYFTSSAEDVSGAHDVFRVRTTGGTPMAVAADRYESEFFAAPSPQGGQVAISTRARMPVSQWWRNGHAHIDEAEIWVLDEATTSDEVPTYRPLSTGGKNLWPMWGPEGANLYFMSDRSGAENLWTASVDGSAERQLTRFSDGRVLWPSISADGGTIAFERDFGIWTYDVGTGAERRLDISLLGSIEGPTPELQEEDSGWGDMAVSPDGKKWAFTAGGDVWATTMEGDVPATRVTMTAAAEGGILWAEDSEEIVYYSWRTGTPKLFAYDFTTDTERQVTSGEGRDAAGEFSPDGSSLAYSRMVDEERELRIMDWESGADRRLAIDLRGGLTWSPDGRWIAYLAETDEFSNVMIIPAAGGEPRQVSFVANSNASSLDWSAKGDYLVYRTSQRTEDSRLVKVDLVPLPPTFDWLTILRCLPVVASETHPGSEAEEALSGLRFICREATPRIGEFNDEFASRTGLGVRRTLQTLWGFVQMNVYETGREILELGVVPLANMIPEMAYIKLGWALGVHPDDPAAVKQLMTTSVAGEMTEKEPHDGYLIFQGGIPEVQEFLGKVWR